MTHPEPVRPWRIVVFGGVGAVVLGVTFAMLVPKGFPGAPDTRPAGRPTAAAATAPSPQFRAISGKYAAPDRAKVLAAYMDVAKVNNAEGVGAVARASMDCFQKLARQPDYGLMDYCLALDAFGAETYEREAGDAAPPSTYFGQGPVRRQKAVQSLTAGQTDANARLLDTNRLIQEISLAKPDVPPPPPPPPPQPVALATAPPPVVAPPIVPPPPPAPIKVASVEPPPAPKSVIVIAAPKPAPVPPAKPLAARTPPVPATSRPIAVPPRPVQAKGIAAAPRLARPLVVAKVEPPTKALKRPADLKALKPPPRSRGIVVKPIQKAPIPRMIVAPRKPPLVIEARRTVRSIKAPPPAQVAVAKGAKGTSVDIKVRLPRGEKPTAVPEPRAAAIAERKPAPAEVVAVKTQDRPAASCGGRTRGERMLCEEPSLQVADRRMSAAYRRALDQTQNPKALAAEQNRWLALRDELAPDRAAVMSAYQDRIAELRRKGE